MTSCYKHAGVEKRILQMGYAQQHINESIQILQQKNINAIENMASLLATVKAAGGHIFFLGVGGSAGNCSHAVNDFRKIVGIEAYAPTDNVSELTACTNDEGWATIYVYLFFIFEKCILHFLTLCRYYSMLVVNGSLSARERIEA